jgi:hypothetical protein
VAGRGEGIGVGLLAVGVVVPCCGLPFLLVAGGGILAAMRGLAARYWPITVVGLAAAIWGPFKLGRLVAARNRALRGRDRDER